MEAVWFALVAAMLTAYVVLDGFDLGAGIIHRYVARTHGERAVALSAIEPVWDANEVWLIAAGALYFAFPRLYAASFSGFYLALMMVLWLLIVRGVSVGLRSQVQHPLWWSFFDFAFSSPSALLAFFYGVAIGNVLRGVPLGADGYFFEPLWTDFGVSASPGILDWYTLLLGALSFAILTVHGAHYVALRTEGAINRRAREIARGGWYPVAALAVASLFATISLRPEVLDKLRSRPWGWLTAVAVASAVVAMRICTARGRDFGAFAASSVLIMGLVAGAAFAMYPYLLFASTGPAYGLTVHNTKTGEYSLSVGLVWWLSGIALAAGCFAFVYRSFRGKVEASAPGLY